MRRGIHVLLNAVLAVAFFYSGLVIGTKADELDTATACVHHGEFYIDGMKFKCQVAAQ